MLAVISFAVFCIYVFASICKKGDYPETLSDTYYLWPKWVFPTVMSIIVFTLLPCWMEITDSKLSAFIACAGVLFVACSPDFRNDKGQYRIHIICAYLAAIFAVINMLLDEYLIVLMWVSVMLIFNISYIKKCWIFLLEYAIIGASCSYCFVAGA